MRISIPQLTAICVAVVPLSPLCDRLTSTACAQESSQQSVAESSAGEASPATQPQQTNRDDEQSSDHPNANPSEDSQPRSPSQEASPTSKEPAHAHSSHDSAHDSARGDSAALGVLVGPCPGQAVCVLDTMSGSPAEGAGIEAGDYIVAINDQVVSSPKELKEKIEGLAASDTINVSIWRDGQTLTKQVALASEAKQLPGSHRSWLGVMLSGGSDQTEGVTIQRVHPRGPAAQAGLKSGDRVMELNDQPVESVEQLTDMVQDYEPGAELKLTVRRGEQDIDLSARLGDVREAPLQWFRQSFRMPLDGGGSLEDEFSGGGFSVQPSHDMDMLEEVIDDMRQQIRALQKQVDELGQPAATKNAPDAVERAPARASDQNDVTNVDSRDAAFAKLVQFDGRRRFPSDYRNNWRSDRRDNRIYRDGYDRYRDGYRSYYGNGGYQSNYPYRYYNYGGRPFYYGGGYPYGYRGGIRIGPNLGIWW